VRGNKIAENQSGELDGPDGFATIAPPKSERFFQNDKGENGTNSREIAS
jgi:hypothetical protein